jgi:hypothetical protein
MVIVPSNTPQLLGSVPTTAVITGATGATNVTVGKVVGQEPPALVTITLYVPPARLVNELLAWNVAPPSIEYLNGAVPPVAEIVIIPSFKLQFVGFVEATFVTEGAFGAINTTGLLVYITGHVPFVFLTVA